MHVARSEHCFRVWQTGQREVEKAIIYKYVAKKQRKKTSKISLVLNHVYTDDGERSQSNTCRLTATIN